MTHLENIKSSLDVVDTNRLIIDNNKRLFDDNYDKIKHNKNEIIYEVKNYKDLDDNVIIESNNQYNFNKEIDNKNNKSIKDKNIKDKNDKYENSDKRIKNDKTTTKTLITSRKSKYSDVQAKVNS